MLETLFGSKLRAKVLGWLYSHPGERYFVRQLTALLKEDSTNVSRELARLEKTGILVSTSEGRQKYYQANPQSPVFNELKNIVRKGFNTTPSLSAEKGQGDEVTSPIFNELKNLVKKELNTTPSLSAEKGQGDEVIPLINIVRKTSHISPLSLDGRGTGERVSEVISQRFNIPKDRLAKFCRKHHIKKMSLFGSVLRDDFRPDSDIDILVEFEPGHVPGFAIIDMEAELSQLVGRKVDLRTANELSRYFRDKVVREAKVQYAAD